VSCSFFLLETGTTDQCTDWPEQRTAGNGAGQRCSSRDSQIASSVDGCGRSDQGTLSLGRVDAELVQGDSWVIAQPPPIRAAKLHEFSLEAANGSFVGGTSGPDLVLRGADRSRPAFRRRFVLLRELMQDGAVFACVSSTAPMIKDHPLVTTRLVVRRVKRLDPKPAPQGQHELFGVYRHHAVFTHSTEPMLLAEAHHRDHAIVEKVIADLKSSALAGDLRGDRGQPLPRRRQAPFTTMFDAVQAPPQAA